MAEQDASKVGSHNKEINRFARENLALLTDQKAQDRMFDRLGDRMRELGFVMDGGRGFVAAYSGDAYDSSQELLEVIDQVKDIALLGSAIFSRWRYITHWSNESLLSEENRSWFVTALGRLEELTRSRTAGPVNPTGPLKMVQIISNNTSSGRRPTVDDQIEQQLTIRENGTITRTIADYRADPRGHRIIRTQPVLQIPREEAAHLLRSLGDTFRYAYGGQNRDLDLSAPPGMFKVILTDEHNRTYSTVGSLGSRFLSSGLDLSDQVRQVIGQQDLFVFDGNPDLVHRLEINYKSGFRDENGEIVWNYRERLVFDRRTESAEHVLESNPGIRVRNNYYIREGISSFLDSINERTFQGIRGNPPDIVEAPGEEIRGYELSIYTRKGNDRVIRGTYDKRSLPRDWGHFIEKVLTFLSFYGFGQLFDAERYAVSKRRSGDKMFVQVVFEHGSDLHTYLSEDTELKIDDFVMVPTGHGNTPALAQVAEIIYGPPEQAPQPYKQLKSIIRRAESEDFRQLDQEQPQAT